MGIPKFYRWTSERYPCLYEKIREYQIPEFDNLYLDMNGIIHNCSHPNDEDVHLRIPEENIFRDIFHYIDFLFRMIKPCRVFFMAVDGVAPRAKMNQQRGRRFRSARVAEEQEAEAIRQGEKLPSEDRFDSNCITPGTEFMARLHEQLKYFVSIKVSTDPLWQRKGLCVYLSGHDVPGEGEHKIMDFIRHIRSLPNYDPETRHCLYGLDADLMMLGLSTHELRFALLREEVKFTKPKKKKQGKNPHQKKPKIKEDSPAVYDLTNVSVFASDNSLSLSNSCPKPPSNSGNSCPANVTSSDKSFVDAVNVVPIQEIQPVETVARTAGCSNESDKVQINPIHPPPSADDHNAKGDYKAPLPEKTTFFLLHLSLFRDYLGEEFKELRENLKAHPIIKYDLECLIDDWILMNIMVGNDFVPHLPNLHIVKGALPMLYRTYMSVLPTLDGYLNENGLLNLKRFEVFITKLSQFDLDQFRETYDDMKYKASKTGKNIVLGEKMFEDFIFEDETAFEDEELEPASDELKELARRTNLEIFGETNSKEGKSFVCKEVFPEDSDFFTEEDTEEFRLEFLQHKRNYYLTKCEFKKVDRSAVFDFAKEYVRAIQWVLLYYYKGVSSWGWFYPSHYAPFSSDLRGFRDFEITFDKGQPFRPFEQLLGVLPSQSKKLLPLCYQWLMTEDASPILEYYPKKFELDLNGKRQDWEAVVLIPFIDESKLLTAMQTEASKLTDEENFRNFRGALLCYSYTAEATGPVKSHRDIFPELEVSHIKLQKIEEVTYNPTLLPKGLHPKADVKKIYQGFPSLNSKSFNSCICKAEVKVFEFYAREESLILSFEDIEEESDGLKLGKKILGKSIWVNWPHLEMALVSALYTRYGKYILGRDNIVIKDPKTTEDAARKTFEEMAKGLVERHLRSRGIRLGRLNTIVLARVIEGRKIRCNNVGKVIVENQWSKLEQPYALKTAIYEERVTDMFYLDEEAAKSYLDLYAKGDKVFYLGDKLFGTMGVVKSHDRGTGSVVVEFENSRPYDESNLKLTAGLNQLKSQDFFPSYHAAQQCQIGTFALSRLTGRVLVAVEKVKKSSKRMKGVKENGENVSGSTSDSSDSEDFPALEPEIQKHNIGLDLKFNKTNMEVRGYTSKRDGQWVYSANTIKLVNEFACKFPDVVELLGRADKNKDVYMAADIFPNDPVGRTFEIVQWLDDMGVRNLPRIPINCNVLDDEDIDIVWKHITERNLKAEPTKKETWTIRPNLLYKPGLDKGCIAPIANAKFNLLDRVVCVDRGASVQLGLRGTVVGIQTPPKNSNDDSEEAFKSVSSAAQNALIIMCDPAVDIFDTPNLGCTKKDAGELTEMTGTLAKLLGVNGADSNAQQKKPTNIETKLRPKLVKLFPYQVINLTQGARDLRQDLKKVPVPVKSTNQAKPPSLLNGTVIVPTPTRSYAESVRSGPKASVKILQRPVASSKKESENIPVAPSKSRDTSRGSKSPLPWPPVPKNSTITVEELFAQVAKDQKSTPQSKQIKTPLMMIPTQFLKNTGQNAVSKKSKLATENVTSKSPTKKQAQSSLSMLTNSAATKGLEGSSNYNRAGSSKVFVNSSLKANDHKNKAGVKPPPMKVESKLEETKSSTQKTHTSNQILNLLCQPKNMERVNTVSAASTEIDIRTNSSAVNGHRVPQNEPQAQAHFYPAIQPPNFGVSPYGGIPGQPGHVPQYMNAQNYSPFPVNFVHPTFGYPYYVVPDRNAALSAFFSQKQVPEPQFQHPVIYPDQLPHPPPPPQHWTQNSNPASGDNFRRSQTGQNHQESFRQKMLIAAQSSHNFVPLQVSRSMAGNDPDATNGILKQKELATENEIVKKIENISIAPSTPKKLNPVNDPGESKTLKALLGLVSDDQDKCAVQEPRKSRIAANFSLPPT